MRDLPPGARDSRDFFGRRAHRPPGLTLEILQPTYAALAQGYPADPTEASNLLPGTSHDHLHSGEAEFEKKDVRRCTKM